MDAQGRVNFSAALAYGPIGIVWAFMPIHLRSLGASYSLISLAYFVPALLPPFWGALLDRVKRGWEIVLVATVAQAVGFTIFPFLHTATDFVLVVAMVGLFNASFVPVYAALATWASKQYGRAIGGFWAAASLGFGMATLVGGFLYQLNGVNALFVLGAILGYAGVLAVLHTPRTVFSSHLSGDDLLTNPQSIIRLLKTRRIAILCGIAVLLIIGASAFNVFFTTYLVLLGGSRLLAGFAATATTVLGALAFRVVGPLIDRVGRKPILVAGAASYVVYFLLLYLVRDIYFDAVLWVLPIYPLAQSSLAALVSDYTSPADRGKGLGLLEASISLGGGIGPLVGGIIADATRLDAVIVFSLVTVLASLIVSYLFLSEKTAVSVVKQQPSPVQVQQTSLRQPCRSASSYL